MPSCTARGNMYSGGAVPENCSATIPRGLRSPARADVALNLTSDHATKCAGPDVRDKKIRCAAACLFVCSLARVQTPTTVIPYAPEASLDERIPPRRSPESRHYSRDARRFTEVARYDSDDTRSSFYMEDATTQFQVQGLELDWVCMTWDADLRRVVHFS